MGDADHGWSVLARRRRHRILRDNNHSITIGAQQVLKKVDCWLQDYCLINYGGEGRGVPVKHFGNIFPYTQCDAIK